jgi:hypothetical protein
VSNVQARAGDTLGSGIGVLLLRTFNGFTGNIPLVGLGDENVSGAE